MSAAPTVAIAVHDAATLVAPTAAAPALVERLDRSGVTHVVLGDERQRPGAASVSPTIAGTILARRLRSVGVVVAASPQRDHPFNVARRVGSIDHVAAGRAGLLALPHDTALAAGLADDASSWIDARLDVDALADALQAIRRLWRSWPVESLHPDRAVSDAVDIPHADHRGRFATLGPAVVPTTPQGEPVVLWPVTSADDVATAAQVADVLVVDRTVLSAGRAALADAERRAVADGHRVRTHLRVDLADVLSGRRPWEGEDVAGVQVDVADANGLDALLDTLASDDLGLTTTSDPGTLRDRLGVPRRSAPDLSDGSVAFPAINPLVEESA